MARSEATKKAQEKYRRKEKTHFNLEFQNKSDADIIRRLKEVSNRTDYIRQLIRLDIEKNIFGDQ